MSNTYALPVRLELVHQYFGLSVQRSRLSRDQQGFTTEDLNIYLNAEDPPTRQKFTLAHELIEVFFFALKDENADHEWMTDQCFVALCDHKERYCNKGAAELIMPLPLFRDLVAERPMSLQWAQEVAEICEVSLKATLWRIIESKLSAVALVIWRYKNSPKELKPPKTAQVSRGMRAPVPPKKMRVEEAYPPPGYGFIPIDKSVTLESSIYQAFRDGVATSAIEELDLVGLRGRYFVESCPFIVNNERRVLSLIHLDTLE
jgi:Zn-dependent peptidase ImmA (M78 family)